MRLLSQFVSPTFIQFYFNMSFDSKTLEILVGEVATSKANFTNLTKSVDEVKVEVKEVNGKIDELALSINTLAGTNSNLLLLQRQCNDHDRKLEKNDEQLKKNNVTLEEYDRWFEKYGPMIEENYDDKKDNKRRAKDFLIAYVLPSLISLLGFLGLLWFKNIPPSQTNITQTNNRP